MALEGEPRWHLLKIFLKREIGIRLGGGTLHYVAVGVAGVAVGASEGASDVWVYGPVTHAGGFRVVENGFRAGGVVGDIGLAAE